MKKKMHTKDMDAMMGKDKPKKGGKAKKKKK
mgnify:CR=1 FL=1